MICGINYYETPNELRGCINDMLDMRNLLLRSGVKEENLTILSDDPSREDIAPTRENILNELVKKGRAAKPGDTLIFHYSGHGTYSKDYQNDEADKRDEAICPVDDTTISDDELYTILRRLPKDVKAFVVMDCCHSASVLDLNNGLDKIESKRKPDNQHGYVVEISGCQDNQTSADALLKDKDKDKLKTKQVNNRELIEMVKKRGAASEPRYRGALTAAFLNTVEKRRGLQAILDICFSGSKVLMRSLRNDILSWLKANRFSQVPGISFEGATPATLESRGQPIVHGYRVASHNLRQTAARKNASVYVPTEDLQQHVAKLR